MNTWIADFYARNPAYRALRVAKRARHGVHFEIAPGVYEAHFTGRPMFERNAYGAWEPVVELPQVVKALRLAVQNPRIAAAWLASLPFTTTSNFTADSGDSRINGQNATYSTARTTEFAWSNNEQASRMGQWWRSGFNYYVVYRIYTKFVTSSIGGSNAVSQVNLKMVATTDASTDDFDVSIRKQDWSAQDPLAAPNLHACYTNSLTAPADSAIWRNTSGMSINTQYTSGNLDTTWVNRLGVTYYAIMSSLDVSATPPSNLVDTTQYILLGMQEHATAGYRPVLTVTYSASATGRSFAVICG